MDIISKKHIFLSASGIFVVVSIASILSFGLRQGIDLAGGTNWQFRTEKVVSEGELSEFLAKTLGHSNFTLRRSEAAFSLRLGSVTEEAHQEYLSALKEQFGVEELIFESIGSSVGNELRKKSVWAAAFVLLGISLYVAWAFRKVSRPVSSWKYGLITLVTLAHDVIIPTGLLAFLGWRQGVEIDTNFIVALLVIMGFSVHDTIVVFDRIRENLFVYKGGKPLTEIVNMSIKETIARSINTSLTLILVLLAILFWGPGTLFYFVLTILLGTTVGVYSSIFVASPLLVMWQKKH